MTISGLFGLYWPDLGTPPDILIVTEEPGAEVIVTRRITDRSKRIYVEAWHGAKIVVNGKAV